MQVTKDSCSNEDQGPQRKMEAAECKKKKK